MTHPVDYVWELRTALLDVLRAAWWPPGTEDGHWEPHEFEVFKRGRFVLDDLARKPLRVYRLMNTDRANRDQFFDVISEWMKESGLWAGWIAKTAVETLEDWSRMPSTLRRRDWSYPTIGKMVPQAFTFTAPAFEPEIESKATAQRRIRAAFDRQLEAAFEALPPAQQAPREISRNSKRDLVWTVRALVLGERWGQIAKEKPRVGEDAVRKAVERMADDLEIQIAKRPVGRPRRPA